MNELDKANEAISIACDKIIDMLKMTGCKSYVNYSKDSIEAEQKHQLRNQRFEAESRNVFFDDQNTACKQIIAKVFPNDDHQILSTSQTPITKKILRELPLAHVLQMYHTHVKKL